MLFHLKSGTVINLDQILFIQRVIVENENFEQDQMWEIHFEARVVTTFITNEDYDDLKQFMRDKKLCAA